MRSDGPGPAEPRSIIIRSPWGSCALSQRASVKPPTASRVASPASTAGRSAGTTKREISVETGAGKVSPIRSKPSSAASAAFQ